VLCDRNDIGGISCPFHAQTENASIFVYDGYPGGVGLAREAFRQIDQLLRQTQETVAACGCDTGCPSCVHSPKCGSGNRPIDKQACLRLLEAMLQEADAADQPGATEDLPVPKILPFPAVHAGSLMPPGRPGLEALPARYGVFDLETIRSAEEVGGWHQAHRMGISVAVVFDAEMNEYVTYLEHEIDQLIAHLCRLELVVGFNNKRFDNRVLSGYTDADLDSLPTLDLLEEVQKRLGYRLRLNSLAEHTFGTPKTADGLQALQWYKEGRLDLIRQYCKKDVEITRNLLLHGLEEGYFLFANKSKQTVRLPMTLDKTICGILAQGQSNAA
jgi:DEAD/DEAH box helicase domain-containing protein